MKNHIFSIIYMFLITFCFTTLVSAVKMVHEDKIKTHQKIKRHRIILNVLDILAKTESTTEELIDMFNTRVKPVNKNGRTIYMGLEADGISRKGYAFDVSGPGFWGPIYGMAAVNSNASAILGMAFYKHSETPGLGGRITEDWFQNQFNGLNLIGKEAEEPIFHLTPVGTKKATSELDAITGATQTSRAVESFLNKELKRFIPEIREYLNEI